MHPWRVPWHKFKSSGGGALDSDSKFNSSLDLLPTGEGPTPRFSSPSRVLNESRILHPKVVPALACCRCPRLAYRSFPLRRNQLRSSHTVRNNFSLDLRNLTSAFSAPLCFFKFWRAYWTIRNMHRAHRG